MSQRDVVLLLGAPGAGKGTQAHFLAGVLGVPHVASGDLVPDDVVIDMIVERLDRRDADRGVLLDGFPRTRAQAEVLDQRLAGLGTTVRAALYLDVPQPVLINRLAGRWMCSGCQSTYHERFAQPHVEGICDACGEALFQRRDDQREVVENRVRVYLRDTLPVVNHYAQRGNLHRVDGHREIHEVRAELCMRLGGAVTGQRRQHWHLYIAHAGAGRNEATGRTLCGKVLHAGSGREFGTLAAFHVCPCRACRRALHPHRMRPVGIAAE